MEKYNGNGGHRGRLREKFKDAGINAFAPHELLEMFLQISIPRRDTKPTAKMLIEKHGSIGGALHADANALAETKGVGERTASLFRLYCQLEKCREEFEYPSYRGGFEHYAAKITQNDIGNELYFAVTDGYGSVLYCRKIFDGSTALLEEYFEDILYAAMRCSGNTVYIFQNRSSYETLNIYDEDMRAILGLKKYLAEFGINFADFVVLCNKRYCSYAAHMRQKNKNRI